MAAGRKDISLLEFYIACDYLLEKLDKYEKIHNYLSSLTRKKSRIKAEDKSCLSEIVNKNIDESEFKRAIKKLAPKFVDTCEKINKNKGNIDNNDWKLIKSNLRKLKHRKNTTTIVISTDIYKNLIKLADSNYSNELIYNNTLIKKLIKRSQS